MQVDKRACRLTECGKSKDTGQQTNGLDPWEFLLLIAFLANSPVRKDVNYKNPGLGLVFIRCTFLRYLEKNHII